MLTGAQIRAGRALVGMSAADLSRLSGRDAELIARAEALGHETTGAEDGAAIRRALEAAGVDFIFGTRPGVCLAFEAPQIAVPVAASAAAAADDFELDVAAVASIAIVPTILDIVCRTTGMRFAAVARVTSERWIACSVRDELDFGLLPGGELQVETTLCNEIRESGEAVIIDNVAEDAVYASHHTPQIYGLQSYVSVPIRLQDGSFFGTLCAIDSVPRRLKTPETVRMFEMFADVLGLHLSLMRRVNAAETVLADEQKTSALREQFIAVLGHDLRNPLAAISGAMRFLRRLDLEPRAREIIDVVDGSVERMAGLISNVMDFTRGHLGNGLMIEEKTPVDVTAILHQVVGELQEPDARQRIDLQIDTHAPVRCDPRRIGQLTSNLLANALTYGSVSEPVRLHATTAGGQFELRVSNAGDVIAPEVLQRIFKPFSRGSVTNQQGLGLGLYIAHEIATAHGGTLDVASDARETTFMLRMPL